MLGFFRLYCHGLHWLRMGESLVQCQAKRQRDILAIWTNANCLIAIVLARVLLAVWILCVQTSRVLFSIDWRNILWFTTSIDYVLQSEVPQFIVFTADDFIQSYTLDAIKSVLGQRKNPNGCPIRMTYFTSTQYTNYSLVTSMSRPWFADMLFCLLMLFS